MCQSQISRLCELPLLCQWLELASGADLKKKKYILLLINHIIIGDLSATLVNQAHNVLTKWTILRFSIIALNKVSDIGGHKPITSQNIAKVSWILKGGSSTVLLNEEQFGSWKSLLCQIICPSEKSCNFHQYIKPSCTLFYLKLLASCFY